MKIIFYAGSVFVALIAIFAVVIFSSISSPSEIQQTSNDSSADLENIMTREEWNEWYRNANSIELENYHNEVVRDAWVAQYDFEQEFHPEDGYVVEYLSALVIQKEILQGNYQYGDEKIIRYHEWLFETFDVPNTIKDVDQELLNLVGGDMSNLSRINDVHYHNQRTVMIAEPPFELWETDPDWWWLQNRLSACQHDETFDCDTFIWAYENNRPLTEEELELTLPYFDELERQWRADKESKRNNNDSVINSLLDFLPKASATYRIDKYSTHTLHVSASSCDAKRCTFSKVTSGIGTNDATLPSDTRHVNGDASVRYSSWISTDNSEHAIIQAVSITGEIDQPDVLCQRSDIGTISATITCSINPPGRDHVFLASSMSNAHAYYN